MARPSSKKASAGNAAASSKESKDKKQTTASRKTEASSVHSLYDLLGVAKDASPRDITAAYRRRALMCHPDKVRQRQARGAGKTQDEGEDAASASVEEATKHFQQLQAAYNVLSDPRKRERYDRTGKKKLFCFSSGETGDDELCGKSYEEAYAFYKSKFNDVTEDAIEQFKARYIGSEEEKEDISDFLSKFNGDLTHFFEFIPLSDPSDAKRYMEILSRLVKDKNIKETPAYKKSIREFEDIAEKYQKKFEKEKQHANNKRKGGKTDHDDLASLALAIRGNMSKREAATNRFLEELGQKYSKKRKKA
ncbi:hypothetical protein Esti_000748 [Eimeria stiedai]